MSRAIALPPGVEVPIEFPPFSYYPLPYTYGPLDEKEKKEYQKRLDQTDAIIAALNTSYFPVLRNLHHSQINQRLATWQP